MSARKKVGVKGKPIHSQAREIVANVLQFMKEEAESGLKIPLTQFKARVLAATKIGEATYRKINKEAKAIASGKQLAFSSPKQTRKRNFPKSNLPTGEFESLKSIVHDYYIIEKRRPTLKGIYTKMLDSGIDFQGGIATLSKIIKAMGFRWRKTADNRNALVESHDIRIKRIDYLEQLHKYVQENRPIIFTDESYIHSTHTSSKGWSDESQFSFKKPLAKGRRLIMVHAGGRDGFIPNALLMFRSGSKSGDYHDDMNHDNFMKWIRNQLVPNLPPRAVLVIDNASYHNVKVNRDPTSNTSKPNMIKWLAERNIHHDPRLTKPQLYKIIMQHKNKSPQYVLDTEFVKNGFRVLRLPPYHPELNPIEMIWALVKNSVASRNTTFKLDDVAQLAKEKFEAITPEEWLNICEHVDKVVEGYMQKEHLFDEASDSVQFMVNTGESSEDEMLFSSEEDDETDED